MRHVSGDGRRVRNGVFPLHCAAHARRRPRRLAAYGGANPAARSRAGLTVLHEAVAAGDPDVVRLVVEALNAKYAASYALKAARVAAALQQTCGFVAHVSWKLVSWMPRVGWFRKSDTTTIAKRGNAFRFDANVVGIGGVPPLYKRATVLLLGSKRLAYSH